MENCREITHKGILHQIVLRGSYPKSKSLAPIISHQDSDVINFTKIKIDSKNAIYCRDFVGNITNDYVGKKISLTEYFKTKDKIQEHRQVLCAEGLPTLEVSLVSME